MIEGTISYEALLSDAPSTETASSLIDISSHCRSHYRVEVPIVHQYRGQCRALHCSLLANDRVHASLTSLESNEHDIELNDALISEKSKAPCVGGLIPVVIRNDRNEL